MTTHTEQAIADMFDDLDSARVKSRLAWRRRQVLQEIQTALVDAGWSEEGVSPQGRLPLARRIWRFIHGA